MIFLFCEKVEFVLIVLFRKQFFKKKIKKNNHYTYWIYFILIILFIEWFYNHPALRYGGYCLIALLVFIPVCLRLEKSSINKKYYNKSVISLIIITVVVFNLRNFNRLAKEINRYNYEPIKITNFKSKKITIICYCFNNHIPNVFACNIFPWLSPTGVEK